MKATTFTFKAVIASTLFVASLLTTGCGGNKSQVGAPAPTTGGNSLTSSTCTKQKCEPADLAVSANFAASGVLIGYTGEPVVWNFYGIDQNTVSADGLSSDRKVVVLLNNVPKGSDIVPDKKADLASEARIDWTPTKRQKGTLEFIARDYERCVLNESKETCNQYVFLKEYDKRFSDNVWEVLDKDEVDAMVASGSGTADDVVKVSDPNCGNPTSDSQINASIMKLGVQVLMGGGLTSILPSIAGSVLNGGSNAAGVNPTEC